MLLFEAVDRLFMSFARINASNWLARDLEAVLVNKVTGKQILR
jgi:hypothetical protein